MKWLKSDADEAVTFGAGPRRVKRKITRKGKMSVQSSFDIIRFCRRRDDLTTSANYSLLGACQRNGLRADCNELRVERRQISLVSSAGRVASGMSKLADSLGQNSLSIRSEIEELNSLVALLAHIRPQTGTQ
jgi:hypothetical protein